MTNERDNHEIDELVSKTYRALAKEQTPEHLDNSVLRMAADTRSVGHEPVRRSQYAFSAWMKPAAWAATVGLSLAIVLEVTQFTDAPATNMPVSELSEASSPTPAGAPESAPAAAASVRDQFVPRDDNILEEAKRIAELKSGPNQANYGVANTPVPQKADSQSDGSSRSDLRDRAENTARSATSAQPEAQSKEFAAIAPTVSSTMQQKRAQLPVNPAAEPQPSQTQKLFDVNGACKDHDRETAEAWFTCIEALRASGNSEGADLETKAFQLQHPDFLPHK